MGNEGDKAQHFRDAINLGTENTSAIIDVFWRLYFMKSYDAKIFCHALWITVNYFPKGIYNLTHTKINLVSVY